jgi:hypothetical protein
MFAIQRGITMRKGIVIHSNYDRKEYFFSTYHCQSNTPEGFVVTSFYLPFGIVPRPEFPNGWIDTVEDLVRLHFGNSKEIHNPDPLYQPNTAPEYSERELEDARQARKEAGFED